MWALKVFGVMALVFTLGVIGAFIRSRLAGRRIRNWSGTGVNKDLGPASVAVLMGMHPSALVLLVVSQLEMRDRVETLTQVPLRIRWKGPGPQDAIERAVADAIEDDGALSLAEVLAVLEAVYEKANGEMGPYSGRETTLYYREVVENMWRQFIDEGEDDPSMISWLLLNRNDDEWHRIGGDEVGDQVRAFMRRMNLAEQHLVTHKAYLDAVKNAKQGYFRYRKDLKIMTRHPISANDDDYWINAVLPW